MSETYGRGVQVQDFSSAELFASYEANVRHVEVEVVPGAIRLVS